MDQKKIGAFIADRRKYNGFTQCQLAEILGITDKAISKWETGRSMPDLSLFNPLCENLHITLNELMLGELISDENIKQKSDQVLLDVLTNWLGESPSSVSGNEGKTVLKLTNVNKVYKTDGGSICAVNDVSFEVIKGKFVGIMGSSGSGKTTLLNLIATIDKLSAGDIEINGRNISGLSENELAAFRRENLGFVFQEYNLLDNLTVYENIALALTIKGTLKTSIKDKIVGLAEKLNISDILNKFPYEISGGQRQRCACLRAIATDPDVILADEPTGALDSHSARQLLESLVALCKSCSATILMVTHDALSASYCDRVMFMHDGKIKSTIRREDKCKHEFFTEILDNIAELGGFHYVS